MAGKHRADREPIQWLRIRRYYLNKWRYFTKPKLKNLLKGRH